MEHIYQNIDGWFTFPNLYKEMVQKFDNATFVEVGTWKGKSAAFMAVEIANSNKNIKFYCVDTWKGSEEHQQELYIKKDKLYKHFLNNIELVKEYIIPIKKYSLTAVKQFQDENLDFVFIDASHDYNNVLADLNAWYPKVKPGGVLAGHDYHNDWPGVIQAVNEFVYNKKLKLNVCCDQRVWILNK